MVLAQGVEEEIRIPGHGVFPGLFNLYVYRLHHGQYGAVSGKSVFLYADADGLRDEVQTEKGELLTNSGRRGCCAAI